MMKNSVTKNYVYNVLYQVLMIILPIVTTPYISRVLGAENIGIYGYTLSISAYFILFGSLGMTLYGQREIAYNQKNKKEYTKIFEEVLIMRLITMIISIAIFYFTLVLHGQYKEYYKILILEILANAIDISWFLQGLEEFKKTVSRNLIIKILSIIAIFAFVKTKNDLYIYFIIYVLSILFGNLSLWLYLPKYLEKVKLKELNIFRHLKPAIILFIPQIAIQVYTILDKTMIGLIIMNKSEVGYYEQAQKLVKMALSLITSMGLVMMPRVASTYEEGNKNIVIEYMYKSFNLVYFLAFPMIIGLLTVSSTFVPWFFGEEYNKVAMLINIISPIILFIGLSNAIGNQYLLAIKRQKEYTISVLCGALINLVMNSMLIWKLGALGASIGTVIAELTVTVVQLFYVRKEFNLKKIFKMSIKYCFSSLLMYIILIILNVTLISKVNSPAIQIGTDIIIGILIYFSTLIILKDNFVNNIIKKILRLNK